MTLRGNIINPRDADRAREYAYGVISRNAPRGISPTDIDGAVEANWHYLFWEFKTNGVSMKFGQRLFWDRLLTDLAPKAILIYAHHPRLDVVQVPQEIVRFEVWRSTGKHICRHGPFHSADELQALNDAFYRWAEHDSEAIPRFLNDLELPF